MMSCLRGRHDTQHNDTLHNDIQHNDTQNKGLICDTQHNNNEWSYVECLVLFIIMLSVKC